MSFSYEKEYNLKSKDRFCFVSVIIPTDDRIGIYSRIPVARISSFPNALTQMLFTYFHILTPCRG